MPSVAFFLWTLLLGQGAGVPTEAPGTLPGAEDDSDSTASIVGVVTRSGTGEPIARAEVVLARVTNSNDSNAAINVLVNPEQPPSSTTDAGGDFVIEDIAPGEYRIIAYHNGFVRQEYGQREPNTPGTPFDLIAGQEFEASFQMVPAGTITGRIYDKFGEPVPYAQVQAMQPRVGPDGQENFVPAQSDSTNDRGEYRLFWLPPGEYFVSAATSNNRFGTIFFLAGGIGGGTGPNTPSQSQQMAAFFPGVPDVAQAAPITLRAGDELAGIDIRLEAKTTFTISGRVISPSQLGGFGSVMMRPTNPTSTTGLSLFNSSPTDSQGNFTIQNVAQGSYVLEAEAQGIGGRRLIASLEVEVTNRDIENVTLTMSAGIDISGGVFVEETQTPGATEAVSGLNVSQLRVFLMSQAVLSSAISQPTDTEGGFQIEGVVPGEYMINVNMPNQMLYLKRVLLGSEETTPGDPITIPPGFSGQLNLLVSPNGGRIDGIASNGDGEAIPNATITLLPLDMPETPVTGFPPAMLFKQARTGGNGGFSLRGVAPGEYRLFAWESTQPVPFMNSDFMRRFETRAERVTIQEGDGLNLNLEVIPESETQ